MIRPFSHLGIVTLICLLIPTYLSTRCAVVSAIPTVGSLSNDFRLSTHLVAATASFNVSRPTEFSCSSALYGVNPNKESCIEAIRQIDSRDDKEQSWKERSPNYSYDIGLPWAYWSCTSYYLYKSIHFTDMQRRSGRDLHGDDTSRTRSSRC